MSQNEIIQKILKFIKLQIGLKLVPDTSFTGIRQHNGKKYFNVELKDRVSESNEFDLLERFANRTKLIKIEPNGVKRVAIYFDDRLLNNLNEYFNHKNRVKITGLIRRIIKEELNKQ